MQPVVPAAVSPICGRRLTQKYPGRVSFARRRLPPAQGTEETQDVEEEERARYERARPYQWDEFPVETDGNAWWPFGHRYSLSITHVLRKVWSVAEGDRVCRSYENYESFAKAGLKILFATSPVVLQWLLQGRGMMRGKLVDRKLHAVLVDRLYRPGNKQPCCYVIEHADKNGFAPSANEYKLAFAKALGWDLSAAHKEKLREVVGHFKRLLEAIPADEMDKPLPVPFRDVGYTIDPCKRLPDHFALRNTNWLMQTLTLAMEEVADDKYFLQGNVFFECFDDESAQLAEPLFSLLAGSYHTTGRGLNTAPAGIQTSSRHGLKDKFAEWTRATAESDDFRGNAQAEILRLEALAEEHVENLAIIRRALGPENNWSAETSEAIQGMSQPFSPASS